MSRGALGFIFTKRGPLSQRLFDVPKQLLILICCGARWAESVPLSRFALVVYSCRTEDLKWINSLVEMPPVYHVGCQTLSRVNMSLEMGCTESHGYLEFVTTHYDRLEEIADVIVFTHGHETSWHYPVPIQNQLMRLFADNDYVSANDAGGVYCLFNKINAMTGWGHSQHMDQNFLWQLIFNETGIPLPLPPRVHYPCCGTFWVKSTAIRRRSLDVYQQVLANTYEQSAEHNRLQICGRVGESSWMVLFSGLTEVNKPSYCSP
jgi:hypothetical protein